MRSLERYWFGEVALARPYLALRFVLVLLAFDTWLNMIPEGAKYGVGSFNVAHFPWFEGFVPSSGFYVGVLAFTGVLALSQALYRPHRIAIVLIAAGYTIGWSCSLLDSVSYHYLLSLYLVCFAFFPMLSARSAFSRSGRAPRGSAWAYVLFCVTTATVYFYVAAWSAASPRGATKSPWPDWLTATRSAWASFITKPTGSEITTIVNQTITTLSGKSA